MTAKETDVAGSAGSHCSLPSIIAAMRGSAVQAEGWDSYGAAAVSDKTIDAAMQVAHILDGHAVNGQRITMASPTPRGGIILSDNDESVWIEVYAE